VRINLLNLTADLKKADIERLRIRLELEEHRLARAKEQLDIAKDRYQIALERRDIIEAQLQDAVIELKAIKNPKIFNGRILDFFRKDH
jgi:hypothetical protein